MFKECVDIWQAGWGEVSTSLLLSSFPIAQTEDVMEDGKEDEVNDEEMKRCHCFPLFRTSSFTELLPSPITSDMRRGGGFLQ